MHKYLLGALAVAFAIVLSLAEFQPAYPADAASPGAETDAVTEPAQSAEDEADDDTYGMSPVVLNEPIGLPNGEFIEVQNGQRAFELRRTDDTLNELLVKGVAGKGSWHLYYDTDGTTLSKAEEKRPDGKLKRVIEIWGDDMTVSLYYADGEQKYSQVSISQDSGERTYEFWLADGTAVLSQAFDANGMRTSETAHNAQGDLLYEYHAYPEEGTIIVTRMIPGVGIDFQQTWEKALGTPVPTLNLSWGDDPSIHREHTLTLSADGKRILTISTEQPDGNIFIDEVTADGKFIARRKVTKPDGTVLSDKPLTNRPRVDIPARMLIAPPPPADREALGLFAPQ